MSRLGTLGSLKPEKPQTAFNKSPGFWCASVLMSTGAAHAFSQSTDEWRANHGIPGSHQGAIGIGHGETTFRTRLPTVFQHTVLGANSGSPPWYAMQYTARATRGRLAYLELLDLISC